MDKIRAEGKVIKEVRAEPKRKAVRLRTSNVLRVLGVTISLGGVEEMGNRKGRGSSSD